MISFLLKTYLQLQQSSALLPSPNYIMKEYSYIIYIPAKQNLPMPKVI